MAVLKQGQSAVVSELLCEGLTRSRLLDLGLVPGTPVEAAMLSPLGDPAAYIVRGSTVALRLEEAEKIVIDQICEKQRGEQS
ncbi:MAG: ferrous iron transport protein A [Armatimonadetes bacterium]|nr:ferrous iron transport protein A [Armatimonadota bacterium]